MHDPNFHELLGDDGEFLQPVDPSYGVYQRHFGCWWSAFGGVIIGLLAVLLTT